MAAVPDSQRLGYGGSDDEGPDGAKFTSLSTDEITADQPLLPDPDELETPNCEHSEQADNSDNDLEVAPEARHKRLTLLNGLAIVISLQIGSGIFSAPSQVSQFVPSPGMGVIVWILGGLLVWTGAASFIELGLTVTCNGGVQEYLRYCYGDFMGFLFTWTWVSITKPCSMAIIATVFADHICHAILPDGMISTPLIKMVALLGTCAIAVINCLDVGAGVRAANVFLVMKLVTVTSIAVIGITAGLLGNGGGVNEKPGHRWFDSTDKGTISLSLKVANFVTSLFGALFSYGGWEAIGFVVGDLIDPARNLPRILHSAQMIVISLFAAMNIALYLILPMDVMRSRYTVVVDFGQRLLGGTGAVIYSLTIAASAMGALNANIFATSALCVVASERRYFPKILANLHFSPGEDEADYYRLSLRKCPGFLRGRIIWFANATSALRLKSKVPIYAILLNCFIACIYVITGTFNGLVTFIGISEYFFFLFAVFGIYIIRRRQTERGQASLSYRTWTGNPIIFTVVSAFVVTRGVITDYIQGIILVTVMGIGWITFRIKFRREEQARGTPIDLTS